MMIENSKTSIESNTASWMERKTPGLKPRELQSLTAVETEPSTQCSNCHIMITNTSLNMNAYVCPNCDHHLPMQARYRLNWFLDDIQESIGEEFLPENPLGFVDTKSYPDRILDAQDKTGETEALIAATGTLKKLQLVTCVFDFKFMGGSMSSVVGDRFVAAAETALKSKIPLVCFAASGGARMQEGLLSLMQMARTSAAIEKLKQAGIPYLVVLTNPVYGGVTASLAMIGDIHIAEPKAMIGFAGKRVIEQTVRETLEEPFQRAEFLLDHGVIDQVVHRHQLTDTIYRILAKLTKV